MSLIPEPFVSFVTPFHNTAAYLRECIESVLRQSHQNWEYVLVDNFSSDGSRDIAESFAARDERIRFVSTDRLLTQVQNYNFAVGLISSDSRYTKVVEADNWLYPDCVSQMVAVAEGTPSIGVVSAYCITERTVRFLGLPRDTTFLSGREAARRHFVEDAYLFGAPTTVLMRSDLVRARRPFYDESQWLVEDLSACYELLRLSDFGFVHQVLTFVRTDNEGSIQSARRGFDVMSLDRLAVLVRHGRDFLTSEEYDRTFERTRGNYYTRLARGVIERKGKRFWDFHTTGLESLGMELERKRVAWKVAEELLRTAANPGSAAMAALRSVAARRERAPQISRTSPR